MHVFNDRAITELEFRHGCLNEPGVRPSIFLFRNPEYDRLQSEKALASGVKREIIKWVNSNPEDSVYLRNLKVFSLASKSLSQKPGKNQDDKNSDQLVSYTNVFCLGGFFPLFCLFFGRTR